MPDAELHRFEDYQVQITELTEHFIGFAVSEIHACVGGPDGPPCYRTEDEGSTEDFAAAERVLTGNIKWDGCSN